MQRRDLLRWTGYLAVARLVGCRPAGEPTTTGTATGQAVAPSIPQPPRRPRTAPAPAAGHRRSEPARSHTVSRLTLHHTAVPLGDNREAPSRLRGHQRFHRDNGWADIADHDAGRGRVAAIEAG